MNTQRSRLYWLAVSFLATFACVHCARAAVVGSVKGTNELYFNINPRSGNTNYMTIGDAGVVDGTAALWSWNGAAALDGSFDTVGSWYSVGSGAWIRNLSSVNAGTNIFNTVIVTNLTVVTNLYLTTNTFIVINGDTNRAGLWTDFGTFIAPTLATNSAQVWTNGAVFAGPETIAAYGAAGGNEAFVSYSLDANTRYFAIGSQASTNAAIAGSFQVTSGTNIISFLSQLVNPVTGVSRSFFFDNQTDPYPDSFRFHMYSGGKDAFTVENGQVYLTNGIVFGEGTTNALYRSGYNLVYTNSDTGVNGATLLIANGNGAAGHFGVTSGNNAYVGSDAANTIQFLPQNQSVNGAYVANGVFGPLGTQDLGNSSDSARWRDFWEQGTWYNYGYGSNTNYSRIAIYHSGTNGAVVFDSQSSGTAGAPRPFMFTNATVIVAGTTNLVSFGGTNTAPSTPGTADKWVSVQVQGEAVEYRLPLYK